MITDYMKLADIVTMLNAASGLMAIWFSLSGDFSLASVFLVLAFVFDSLDGVVARATGGGNDFGLELDSLADVLAFAAAPFVFGVMISRNIVTLTTGIFFALCGILRLARFNITHLKYFEGVPITTNGLLFPLLWITLHKSMANVLPMVYVLMGILMVSSIKIKKLRLKL